MNRRDDYDSYDIEEPSDEEGAESSSEDEIDVLLHGTPDQKRKLLREYLTGESASSSEDEFEKEMEAELSSTMKSMEGTWVAPAAPAAADEPSGSGQPSADSRVDCGGSKQPEYYDDIYFDSDSGDEDTSEKCNAVGRKKKKRHRIPTNDELLYDPDEDDRDQAWMDAKRRGYQAQRQQKSHSSGKAAKPQPLPSSDAVLNCPACMTTLCIDCQRHEKYRTQYRAMFVMNCAVNKEEVLKYQVPSARRRRNRGKKQQQPSEDTAAAAAAPSEVFHPVKCTECSTEVAVFDKDEVYHFFNILASHC
ncbi:E2F-associated phosphoprotein isoform X1 [Lepisosteus oculatus]|uniref:E2F-associated phosphoprotein isoform X1 n=1 Tax=Lepisosteus oculatus TaxID=7918 RepID=UPI00371E99EA